MDICVFPNLVSLAGHSIITFMKESNRFILKGGNVVTGGSISPANILIEEGIIRQLGPPNLMGVKEIDVSGKYILPGFIDIHTHGISSFDFTFGNYDSITDSFIQDPDTFAQEMIEVLRSYAAYGVTGVYATTMAAALSDLLLFAGFFRQFLEQESRYSSLVKGINLEGTFIKSPAFAGAQNPKYFYNLKESIIEQLQTASGDRLKIVNIPPEHGEEGISFIEYLKSLGVVVSGGHSGATAIEFFKAVNAGLQLGVHFLNGPSRSSSKGFYDGGAVESMLKSDEVYLELILDGYHVHPAYVRDVISRKGVDRVIGITDSMFITSVPDIDYFSILGLRGKVSKDRKYLQVIDKEDTLFGSILTMEQGFANLLNWFTSPMPGVWHRNHEEMDFAEALSSASQIFSGNPARLMRIYGNDEQGPGTGSIEPGKYADLVIVDIQTIDNDYQVEISKTFSQGKLVYERNEG